MATNAWIKPPDVCVLGPRKIRYAWTNSQLRSDVGKVTMGSLRLKTAAPPFCFLSHLKEFNLYSHFQRKLIVHLLPSFLQRTWWRGQLHMGTWTEVLIGSCEKCTCEILDWDTPGGGLMFICFSTSFWSSFSFSASSSISLTRALIASSSCKQK